MSSDRPSDAPSSPAEATAPPEAEGQDLAALVRSRGAPLLEALERHLPGSRDRAAATASFAFAGAAELGFGRAGSELSREVAMLHEIGLIYVPAEIAAKPPDQRDALDTATWATHYEAAYQLARGAGIPDNVCGWLLRVRERYDGSGPERIPATAIPIESRLIRGAWVCETTIATASGDLPPARAAIKDLIRRAGGELDPRVVVALVAMLDRAAGR
jgi:HD-GYP domain-containing protein (c-di-GMP phosphodiesterase class II)